jgi:hypothetical protein
MPHRGDKQVNREYTASYPTGYYFNMHHSNIRVSVELNQTNS